jgi:acetyl esterase/lipase
MLTKLARRTRANLLYLLFACALPQQSVADMTQHNDIVFARAGDRDLLLDLYLPEGITKPTLIVWLHGGAWRGGSKANVEGLGIVEHGFAFASVGFRNSGEAVYPAQIHDTKAAIRYLRANAEQYGYDADNIAVWGYSSGGHLAALTAVSNGNAELEGNLGDFLQVSSDVQAVIDGAGPTNLHTILHQSTPHGVNVRAPAITGLLGKPFDDPDIQAMVTLASPALLVTPSAPPLLLSHGVQDNQVPINQAIELQKAYEAAGRHVETEWFVEGTHGSGESFREPYLGKVADFLRRVL